MRTSAAPGHDHRVPQTYLVESYGGELSETAVRTKAAVVAAAAQGLQARGRRVTFLGCLLVPDDEVCFWRFAGTSIADVRAAARRAGLDIQRIARSVDIAEHEPGTIEDGGRTDNGGPQ